MAQNVILKYFPELTETGKERFAELGELYRYWNLKINLISRKDIDTIYTRHILHSLAIAKVLQFEAGSSVLDVGTGGGFPGIPLAVLFPETRFCLVDSIGKKIAVVQSISEKLGLQNIVAEHTRAETVREKFDFVVSRAVTSMPDFVNMVRGKCLKNSKHMLANGILYLKGGNLQEELRAFPQAKLFPVSDYFDEPFFETKSVVYLPLS